MITQAGPEWIREVRRGAKWIFWGLLASFLGPNLVGFLVPFFHADMAHLRWAGLVHACMGIPITIGVFALTVRPQAPEIGVGRPTLRRNLRTLAALGAVGQFVHWVADPVGPLEAPSWLWIPTRLIGIVAVLVGLAYLRQLSRWLDLQNLDSRFRLLTLCYLLLLAVDYVVVTVVAEEDLWVDWLWADRLNALALTAMGVWALTLLHRLGTMLALMLAGKCVACRYMLCDLPSPRCPECGRPFVLLSAVD